jgi:cell wall-associated NlpC family hydrolase
MSNRQQVVECARSFIGTPFAHAGRSKGRGLDCVGLPLMVAGELGLTDTNGQPLNGQLYTAYTPQPVDTIVLDLCATHLRRKGLQDIKPGDILVMKVPSTPCHVGILTEMHGDQLYLVHAYTGVGKCVEQPVDVRWKRRIVAAFEFPNLED